jgi:hypothetical protein
VIRLAQLASQLVASPLGLAMAAALLSSVATLVVGLTHWRSRSRGQPPSERGPWLELSCIGLNLGVLVAAYRATFGVWQIAIESGLAKIDLVVLGLFEVLPVVSLATGVLPSSAAVAAAVCWWGRGRARHGPLFLAVGLFVLGAVVPFSVTLHGYASSGARNEWCVGPCRRERVLDMERERPRFRFAAGVASAAIAGAALLLCWSRRQKSRASLPKSLTAASSLSCCAGAVVLFWHARPIARENAQPISMDHSFANASLSILAPVLTEGVGPDQAGDAPLVRLGASGTTLDAVPAESDSELEEMLRAKRQLWLSAHGGAAFPGMVLIDVAPGMPVGRLARQLDRIHAAGYRAVRFLLADVQRQERPLLGPLVGQSVTAVAAELASSGAGCAPLPMRIERVAESAEPEAGQLLQRWVALRRANHRLCIVTGARTAED